MEILIPIMVLGGLGLIFGLWLVFAYKIFAVKDDPRVEQILSMLPGINCGACGYAGCHGFAKVLAAGNISDAYCNAGGEETNKQVSEFLGIDLAQKTKNAATLICAGAALCSDKYIYSGPATCSAANLIFNGQKSCQYACLGFGDCQSACPFGAIIMGKDNLPHIDIQKCTACGKCIKACPKNVLVLTPADKLYYIKCSSRDKGADVMKICKVGCIACTKCVKVCPSDAVTIEDNLARINYAKCINCGECVKACPTNAIAKKG